ncbi:MAG: MBL fold metallo-hydrolase [Alphaproteobacteria bacterium]|nr:MBL fold metallo-hydrolase [Alphaproteobacteria bacterium]
MIKQVPVSGAITTNAYFYIDETTEHGFLIDAGAEAQKLMQIIAANNWHIEQILLTHGHFDHIGAVNTIRQKLKIPCSAHKNSQDYLLDTQYNLSAYFEPEIKVANFLPVVEGDIISLKENPTVSLKVIHTPGHTQDSVVYYDAANNVAFVGDTIFKNSYGRTDMPGGDTQQIIQSIKNKILILPENTVLYSGHTPPTTVKAEKQNFGL